MEFLFCSSPQDLYLKGSVSDKVDSSEIRKENVQNYSYNYPRYFAAHTAAAAQLSHECGTADRTHVEIRKSK
jgi:hypothetical protein